MKNTCIIILLSSIFLGSTLFAGANSIKFSFSHSDSLPGNILVINSFDVISAKVRKNKKELFMQLADSLRQIIYEVSPAPNGKMIAVPELIKDTSDSNIHSLMVQNNAAKAIVIKTLDVYFDQTGVEVTRDASGKNRVASFDICSFVRYRLYNIEDTAIESGIGTREFFTHRNVMSGLLAAGPDIVGKKKHAFEAIRKNGLEYLAKEKPWK
jgi:hypothetical protein